MTLPNWLWPVGVTKTDGPFSDTPSAESVVVAEEEVKPTPESTFTLRSDSNTIAIPGFGRLVIVRGDYNRITMHPDSKHRFIIYGDYNTITLSENGHVFTVGGDYNLIRCSGSGHQFTVGGDYNCFTDCDPNGEFVVTEDGDGNTFQYRAQS